MKWKFKVLLTSVLAVLYFGLGCTVKSEAIADEVQFHILFPPEVTLMAS